MERLPGQLRSRLDKEGGLEVLDERLSKVQQTLVPEALSLVDAARSIEGGLIKTAGAEIAIAVGGAMETSSAVGLVKELVAEPDRSVDAGQIFSAAQAVVGQIARQAQSLTESEHGAMKDRASAVLAEANELAKDSAIAQQILKKGATLMAAVTGEDNDGVDALGVLAEVGDENLSAQLAKGRAAVAAASSPAEVYEMLKEDDEFMETCKALCLQYVESAITNVELPPIEGTKDWGTYKMAGLLVRPLS